MNPEWDAASCPTQPISFANLPVCGFLSHSTEYKDKVSTSNNLYCMSLESGVPTLILLSLASLEIFCTEEIFARLWADLRATIRRILTELERVKSGSALAGRARQLSKTSLLLSRARSGSLPVNIFGPQSLKIFSRPAQPGWALSSSLSLWDSETDIQQTRRGGHLSSNFLTSTYPFICLRRL